MLGLIAVLGYIVANVLVIAVAGRHQYGSFGAWWRS